MRIKLSAFIGLVLILFLPFSIFSSNDEIEAKYLDSSTIGYYQSTTCNISLFEFLNKNLNSSQEFYFNNNNYADINCFGQITGVDLNENVYFVSIGTNTSITMLLQSSLWLLLLFLIPKHKDSKNFNIFFCFMIPVIFCFQLFGEERFYNRTNILYSNELEISNFYMLGNAIFYLLFALVSYELFKTRYKNLINYVPFTFLLVGSFNGMNINFYLIILSLFGLNSIVKNSIKIFDYLYILFSIAWIFNTQSNDYFFDGDKLRGFVNSNLNIYSQIFWIVTFYFAVKGALFIFNEGIELLDNKLFIQNLLFSSSFILLFGLIGSNYPIINFLNYIFFGQNKRGMKTLESIDGNTWRGFSASAESIGEFYGFIILFLFLFYFANKQKLENKYLIFLFPVAFGLFKSNNFAAFLSLFLIVFIFIIHNYLTRKITHRTFFTFLALIAIASLSIYLVNSDYVYMSSELLFESTLHQGFYSDPGSYQNFKIIEQKMYERDLNTILFQDSSSEASNSYRFLVNVFTNNLNIPIIPNIVALISVVSLIINRTEMWGIFLAKYDPNNLEVLFGSGPLQLNHYLYGENIYLDVPEYKINSLYLPHSSLLDLFIFFGVGGTLFILLYMFNKLIKANKKNIYIYLTLFLMVNFLKSDSIMYLNSFILIICSFVIATKLDTDTKYE